MRHSRLSIALLSLSIVGGAAGMAHADSSDDDSMVGVHDNNVSVQACHFQIPVNILGVQIPVQDLAASLGLPIASEDSPSEGPDQSCNQSSAGGENEGSTGHGSGEPHRADAGNAGHDSDSGDKDKDKNKEKGGLLGPLL